MTWLLDIHLETSPGAVIRTLLVLFWLSIVGGLIWERTPCGELEEGLRESQARHDVADTIVAVFPVVYLWSLGLLLVYRVLSL